MNPIVYLVDNDAAVKEVLAWKVTAQNSVRPLGRIIPLFDRLFGKGLFMVSGDDWKRMHRIAMRGFGPKQIERFVTTVEQQVEDGFRRFEAAASSDMGEGSP